MQDAPACRILPILLRSSERTFVEHPGTQHEISDKCVLKSIRSELR
jgi:hypothetical protein